MIDLTTDPGYKPDPNNFLSPIAGRSWFVIVLGLTMLYLFIYTIILNKKL